MIIRVWCVFRVPHLSTLMMALVGCCYKAMEVALMAVSLLLLLSMLHLLMLSNVIASQTMTMILSSSMWCEWDRHTHTNTHRDTRARFRARTRTLATKCKFMSCMLCKSLRSYIQSVRYPVQCYRFVAHTIVNPLQTKRWKFNLVEQVQRRIGWCWKILNFI